MKYTNISITTTSGFGLASEAYSKTITIQPAGISYEYSPVEPSESNQPCKWHLSIENPEYDIQYTKICDLIERLLQQEDPEMLDAGVVTITATSSKSKLIKKTFLSNSEMLDEVLDSVHAILAVPWKQVSEI